MQVPEKISPPVSKWWQRRWVGPTVVVLGLVERFIGLGGSVDFVLTRWNEPGWVGQVLRFVVEHSEYFGLGLTLGGIALIVKNERLRTDRKLAALPGMGGRPERPEEDAAPTRKVASSVIAPAPNELAIQQLREDLSKATAFMEGAKEMSRLTKKLQNLGAAIDTVNEVWAVVEKWRAGEPLTKSEAGNINYMKFRGETDTSWERAFESVSLAVQELGKPKIEREVDIQIPVKGEPEIEPDMSMYRKVSRQRDKLNTATRNAKADGLHELRKLEQATGLLSGIQSLPDIGPRIPL